MAEFTEVAIRVEGQGRPDPRRARTITTRVSPVRYFVPPALSRDLLPANLVSCLHRPCRCRISRKGHRNLPANRLRHDRGTRILTAVQRLLSIPSGWPGLGLLFLRSSVALAVLAEGYGHRPAGLPNWVLGAVILFAISCLQGI